MKPNLLLLLLFCLSANAQQKFTVYFDFDIAEANSVSEQKLSGWIAKNPQAQIQKIYGYADLTGDALYNQDLSERRASFVYGELKAANLALESVEEKSFGESKSTSAHNAADRKVEIYYAVPAIQPPVTPPPAEPVASDLKKQIDAAKKGDKIRLKGMNFYNNMDVMLPSSRPVLEELLQVLKENKKLVIQIQGHVCCEPENAQKVSERRAVAVYNYLVRNGIEKDRLSYKAFGASKPVYAIPEKNEDQKVANRRVEIEIIEQ